MHWRVITSDTFLLKKVFIYRTSTPPTTVINKSMAVLSAQTGGWNMISVKLSNTVLKITIDVLHWEHKKKTPALSV